MKSHHLTLVGIVAATTLFTACGGNHGETDGKKVLADTTAVIRVVTTIVKARPFEDWGQYSADLRGGEDAVLTAPTPGGGRVHSVTDVGSTARKGQALCDIDSGLYSAHLKQAQAALNLARGDLERGRANVKEGFVGKSALDKAELDFQGARAALFQAERAHADSRCEAPFTGTLVSRFVERHQTAGPGTQTVRIAALAKLEALVSIPESEAFDYREGQRADFRLLQADAEPVPGTITSLDRAVESRNRVVMARVRIENSGNTLRPGMIGRVRILRRAYDKAIVVPSQAVLRLHDGTAVMVVRAGVAHRVTVTLGAAQGDSVMVLNGLSAGDRIITVGGFQVSEGTKVAF
jgi:membrane fusion protein (multidrug efflux system)